MHGSIHLPQQIHFLASEANDNYDHYDDLENIIIRFYAQGYIPSECCGSRNDDKKRTQEHTVQVLPPKGKKALCLFTQSRINHLQQKI